MLSSLKSYKEKSFNSSGSNKKKSVEIFTQPTTIWSISTIKFNESLKLKSNKTELKVFSDMKEDYDGDLYEYLMDGLLYSL